MTPEDLLLVVRSTCRSWELSGLLSKPQLRSSVLELGLEISRSVREPGEVIVQTRYLLIDSKMPLQRDALAFWVLGCALVPISSKLDLVQSAALDAAFAAWIEEKGVSLPDSEGMFLHYSVGVLTDAIQHLRVRVSAHDAETVQARAEDLLSSAIRANRFLRSPHS